MVWLQVPGTITLGLGQIARNTHIRTHTHTGLAHVATHTHAHIHPNANQTPPLPLFFLEREGEGAVVGRPHSVGSGPNGPAELVWKAFSQKATFWQGPCECC